ncbi:hypothetical protein [Litoribacterium kuwaitense]|uniref:hypothetical protein n=1 Tax=Litoribacterium kuwaitense TaxID=1398745 RepID=UPI0028AB3BF6|nr:hypothetical protein [Litoribacterium kuwaitense]
METVNILEVPFAKATMDEMVTTLEKRLLNEEKTFVVTANPEFVMHAREKQAFLSEFKKPISSQPMALVS